MKQHIPKKCTTFMNESPTHVCVFCYFCFLSLLIHCSLLLVLWSYNTRQHTTRQLKQHHNILTGSEHRTVDCNINGEHFTCRMQSLAYCFENRFILSIVPCRLMMHFINWWFAYVWSCNLLIGTMKLGISV